MFRIYEVVDVDIAAGFLRGIAEDGELRAHEEPAPVERHLIVVADLRPLLAVKTVVEGGEVAAGTEPTARLQIAGTEVPVDAQPDLRLLQGYLGDNLLRVVLHSLLAVGEADGLLAHLHSYHLQGLRRSCRLLHIRVV